MHERSLHVHAEHHAEPDQVDAEPLCRRPEQRDHNESDLEEIEEEREKKNKDIDEDQKADDPAGQRDQKVLHPSVSIDAVEGQREGARADQDEHNEGGQFGRDLRGLARQIPA